MFQRSYIFVCYFNLQKDGIFDIFIVHQRNANLLHRRFLFFFFCKVLYFIFWQVIFTTAIFTRDHAKCLKREIRIKYVQYEKGHLLLVNIQECAKTQKNIENPAIETDPKNISKISGSSKNFKNTRHVSWGQLCRMRPRFNIFHFRGTWGIPPYKIMKLQEIWQILRPIPKLRLSWKYYLKLSSDPDPEESSRHFWILHAPL